MTKVDDDKDLVMRIGQWLMANYWRPLYYFLKENPERLEHFPGFLLKPSKIIYHLGRTHIGIEYVGPERLTELPTEMNVKAQVFDYSLNDSNLLDEIIGFDYNGRVRIPLGPITEDLVLPTNAGADELEKLNWNYSVQSMLLGLNSGGLIAPEGQFTKKTQIKKFEKLDQAKAFATSV
jgi:hypothetical protein